MISVGLKNHYPPSQEDGKTCRLSSFLSSLATEAYTTLHPTQSIKEEGVANLWGELAVITSIRPHGKS